MSTVSVIVPVHNAARWVRDTLLSIERQTVPPERIIVVDDGSTDSSINIIESFALTSTVPVTVLRNAVARGVARARNRALGVVDTDLVGFCDNDDLWHPMLLECVTRLAAQHPRAPGIGVDSIGFADESDRAALIGHQRFDMVAQWTTAPDVLAEMAVSPAVIEAAPIRYVDADDFRGDGVFVTTQLVVRREHAIEAGGFAAWCRGADDWVFHGTVAMDGPIPVKAAPLVLYRIRATSQSHAQGVSHLPLLTAHLALTLGGADPDRLHDGELYQHLVRNHVREGGRLRRALAFALLGGGFGWRDYARFVRDRVARRPLR